MVVNLEKPHFVISLDFEKMWGVFDKKSLDSYGSNIKNVDIVIERTLELFVKYNIHATWAFVGFLLHKDIKALRSNLPTIKPAYVENNYSSYDHIFGIKNIDFQTYYSGLESLYKIEKVHSQEIATHTFSHYYCLENGASLESFHSDLEQSKSVSKSLGHEITSIVFPRNQYDASFLKVCVANNIFAFRGTENVWANRSRSQTDLKIVHRIFRFIDTYFNLSGSNIYSKLEWIDREILNIPSSYFLRPYNPALKVLEPFKLNRFKKAMLKAAQNKSLFHLWWHPHNFGSNLNENFIQLESILKYYSILNKEYGMVSNSMKEIANEYRLQG